MPLDLLVVERVVASERVGAAELVAGHFAEHSGADVAVAGVVVADVAVAGVAELQLVAVAVAVAAAAGERELVLVLVLVVLELDEPVVVPVFVHSDEFVAELVVGGRVG